MAWVTGVTTAVLAASAACCLTSWALVEIGNEPSEIAIADVPARIVALFREDMTFLPIFRRPLRRLRSVRRLHQGVPALTILSRPAEFSLPGFGGGVFLTAAPHPA